jgi:predicted amidohydrolase
MRVALWAVNLATRVQSVESWLTMLRGQVDEAVRVGAEILMIPEYACMAWLDFKPRNCGPEHEIAWMGEQVPPVAKEIKELSETRRIAILPGTWPAQAPHGWVNRAQLMLPDGRQLVQDKLHPIPTERDPKGWLIEPGEGFSVITWRGLRIAIMVCHDVQSVDLAKKAAFVGIDLVLVPSMTEHEKGAMGHKSIFSAANTHAEKYKRSVAAVGAIGTQVLSDRHEPNVGGAAVYKWKSVIANIGPYSNSQNSIGPMIIGNI